MTHKRVLVCFCLFVLAAGTATAAAPDLSAHKGGLVVHTGCGNGSLLRQIATNAAFFAVGLDTNTANVASLRATLRDDGFDGQVMVDEWNGTDLPFIDNFVNALVLENPCNVSSAEVQRVLVPNGKAYRLQGTNWVSEIKPRPAEMDEWTHINYSPANNPVSKDMLVGPLRRMQWYVSPFWTKYHFSSPVVDFILSGGGRVFYVVDESPSSTIGGGFPEKWALIARDAFNGKLLWRKPMSADWGMVVVNYPGFYDGSVVNPSLDSKKRLQKRFVAAGDRFFGVLGFNEPIKAFDAATGEVLRTYPGTESCREVFYHEGRLYLFNTGDPELLVLNADTGATLWTNTTHNPTAISIKNNQLCLLKGNGILALDATTFTQKWLSSGSIPASGFLMQSDPVVIGKRTADGIWLAFDAQTGQQLWSYPIAGNTIHPGEISQPEQIFIRSNLVWTFKSQVDLAGLNPTSGVEQTVAYGTNVFYASHHHRCFDGRAVGRYFISAQEGLEMVSLTGGTNQIHNWTRAACNIGPTPANGLVYVPPASCACVGMAMLHGIYSYAPAGADAGRTFATNERLITGPAFGQVTGGAAGSNDWPLYRYNAQRKSSTANFVPKELTQMWKTTLGGELTAPVIAGGRLFVANKTEHTVSALDAATGAVLWTYAAGGEVDSAPSVWGTCVIFGCGDGRVYCLRAADGALVWRFQAAPRDCRNMQLEQVTSVWPVPGSVLVETGRVYVAAGHSSRLDGGLWIWSLDALTGAVMASNRIAHVSPAVPAPTNEGGLDDEGFKNDVLVSDGSKVWLRELNFDGALNVSTTALIGATSGVKENQGVTAEPHLYSSGNGILDNSWNHRTVWTYRGIHAQYLIVDTQNVYGIKAINESDFQARFAPGSGYILFAQPTNLPGGTVIEEAGVENLARPQPFSNYLWWKRVPLRIQSMVRAGDYLFAAGQPDAFDRNDPFAVFEGRAGGSLWTISPTNGVRLADYTLTSPPVFDGLAAANNCLYLSAMDGSVLCLGQPESAPAAKASVLPASGATNTQFTFDGTGSQDPDGRIVAYEWTVNGVVVSTNAVYATTFGTTGARTVKLMVRDDDGMRGFDTAALSVTSAATDSDGDGLPDSWEIAQVGNLSMNATNDTDGDGLTALQEYAYGTSTGSKDSDSDGLADNLEIIAGTSPSNADSLLEINGQPLTSGQMRIVWDSVADRTYSIWGSSNLASGFTELIAHHQAATPPANTFTDPAARDGTYFYRLQVTQNSPAPLPNAAPVPRDDEDFTATNTAVVISVLANDSDPDFQALTVVGVTQGAHGTVTYTATNVTYTPSAGWTGGTDTFTYTVSDSLGETDTAQVTVYVESSANRAVDPSMRQSNILLEGTTSPITQAYAGMGWCVGLKRPWQWDRTNEWSYAFCGKAEARDLLLVQVIADSKATKGTEQIKFRAAHTGTGDVLQVRVYGLNGTFSSLPTTNVITGGTLLYDSTNVATSQFDWTDFSGTVNYGGAGYDYHVLLVYPDGIAPGSTEFMAVDDFYLGR